MVIPKPGTRTPNGEYKSAIYLSQPYNKDYVHRLEEQVESLTALVQTLKLRQDGYHDFLSGDAFGADVGESDAYGGSEEQDNFIPDLASVSPK
ncbi:hypothetical protein SCUP234_07926 [Seiridium cupressi]